MTMHPNFSDWYRLAVVEPRGDTLELRWSAIEALVENLEVEGALNLARVFHGSRSVDAAFLDGFRTAFHSKDSAFRMRDNWVELRVLAGGALSHVLGRDSSYLRDAVALATVCGDYCGARPNRELGEIIDLARHALDSEAVKARRAGELIGKPAKIELTTSKAIRFDPAGLAQTFPAFAEEIETAFNALKKAQAVLREESNIVWWLFGEYSRDLKKPMNKIGAAPACLHIAKELADLTEDVPGPLSTLAFLDRMLRAGRPKLAKEVTLINAVNQSDRAWREEWGKSAPGLNDLSPIRFAVTKSLETDGRDQWIPAFEKATGLVASQPVSPLLLARQAYDEGLLAKAIALAKAA
jgi:hypothetical protein